jgi:hypothetical protein
MQRQVSLARLAEPGAFVDLGTSGGLCTVLVVAGLASVTENHRLLVLIISAVPAGPVILWLA